MNHPAAPLPLDAEDRSTLEMWARSATAPHRVVSQAKALLMAGDGVANSRIATALGISRPTVLDWRARFRTEGLDSVGAVRPGRGRKPEITADQVQAIVHSTLHETPPGATHWSCRSMAKAAGVSRSTVQRIWDAHGLQPHRVTTFKLSKDPAFGRFPRTCGRALCVHGSGSFDRPACNGPDPGPAKVTITSIPGARVPKNVQIGRKNGMTRSVGADWKSTDSAEEPEIVVARAMGDSNDEKPIP